MAISHFSSSLFLSEAFVLFLMPSFSFSFFVLNIFGGQKRSHLFLHSLRTDMCFAFLFNSHLGYKKATYVKAGGRKARWAPGLDAAMSAWILPTSPFSPQDRRQGGSWALTKSGSRHCRADAAYSPSFTESPAAQFHYQRHQYSLHVAIFHTLPENNLSVSKRSVFSPLSLISQ